MLDSETVETVSSASGNPAKTNLAARIGWAILILATLYICYFSHLGAIGFVGPDEPRYAWIARDMAETGDWVTPRLYGKPWFEKPPLFYWGAALSFKLFGVSEAAARLPSAISALLATLALAWLAWRLYGAETARWLLLLLPTTVGMIGFSHAAATDMPFSAMLTIAMVCASVVLGPTRNENSPIIPQTPWLALILFGFFLGLAVLAKGPAGIILVGGAVFFWALFTKRWRDAFRLFHPAALASFFAIALPWYILCARRNPDFFRIFIIEHNFKRYLTPEFQHIQPFWYYAPILFLAVLPWSVLFIWGAIVGGSQVARDKNLSASVTLFLCWTVFCVLFFSISQSKLPGYILPAIPALVLLMGRVCVTIANSNPRSLGAGLAVFGLALFGVSEFLGKIHLHALANSETLLASAIRVVLMLAIPNLMLGAGFLVSPLRGKREFALALATLSLLFALSFAHRLIVDLQVDPWSPKALALQLTAHHVPLEHLSVFSMGRAERLNLNFYLHRELQDWDRDPNADAYVISGGRRCEHLKKEGYECLDVPLGSSASGWFVSHVTAKQSAGGLPRSGQPQQEK
jgi:4-amino-4-deoxy-L-arabinose transferase-like glycosyltransferase